MLRSRAMKTSPVVQTQDSQRQPHSWGTAWSEFQGEDERCHADEREQHPGLIEPLTAVRPEVRRDGSPGDDGASQRERGVDPEYPTPGHGAHQRPAQRRAKAHTD